MESSDEYKELIQEYGAEGLPPELTTVLVDYFVEKKSKDAKKLDSAALKRLQAEHGLPSNGVDEARNSHDNAATLTTTAIQSITSTAPPEASTLADIAYETYFTTGCGCERRCHLAFSRQVAFEAHLDALDLDRYCASHINHQHLVLLGALNGLLAHKTVISKDLQPDRPPPRTAYQFRGTEVCRRFFLFVFGCGATRLKNLTKQLVTRGTLVPSAHENATATRALVKKEPSELRANALTFILHFAQQNALQLPGRYQRTVEDVELQDLFLLPKRANLSRREIYERYEHASEEVHQETVSYALWNELWDLQFPNIVTLHDRADGCAVCREYRQIGSATSSAKGALSATTAYLAHLNLVQAEVDFYRVSIEHCRTEYEALIKKSDLESTLRHSILASLPSMHYCFDWFTKLSLPLIDSTSHRHSSLHFHTGYSVVLFGVAIEPMRQYILYIIPEFVCHLAESVANLVISLMHHLLGISLLKEKRALIHWASGSMAGPKNGLLVAYCLWRTLVGHHDQIDLSYLPTGHTRCWNDLFMGVFRKKLRATTVTSLADIKAIAERCTLEPTSGQQAGTQPPPRIRAFLVGDDAEQLLLPLYNWEDRLASIEKLPPGVLQSNAHYNLDVEQPGMVSCRRTVTSPSTSYRLIGHEAICSLDGDLPRKLHLEPLPYERRLYLYKTIQPYVDGVKNGNGKRPTPECCSALWYCDPTMASQVTLAATPPSPRVPTKPATTTISRAPRCSYCSDVGHKESNFGKITCPKKRLDAGLLKERMAPVVVEHQVEEHGIVTEATDQEQDHHQHQHQQQTSTMITLLETNLLEEEDGVEDDLDLEDILE